ncbi:MAG: hypothetical protein V1822_00180 [Candidatus Micrarchaeota archaeon]
MAGINNTIQEDIGFARRTEAAYREVEEGKYSQMSAKDFLSRGKKSAR